MRKAIIHLKKKDPVLRRIIEQVGPCSIEFMEPEFSTLVRSIVFQQLSGKVARVIYNRLLEAAGGAVTPQSILTLTPARMREIGLSRQKSAYILDLAKHTDQGTLVFATIGELSDEEVIKHLTVVKGIGVWTAHMFLLFALQRPDVLPTGDLGIRMAIRKAYGLDELPHPKHIEEIAVRWRPYCSVATWYLWRSLEGQAEI